MMKIELTGKHLEITPAIRAHVESHCAKLEQYFKGNTEPQVHAVMTIEKARQKAEIVINWREHTLTAKETDKDLYQAINKVIEKLEKQARRLKEKVIDRKHSAQKIAEVVALEPDDEIAAAFVPPQIIVTETVRLKPMTPEEAVLTLDADKTQFVVFRNAETDGWSVIYKRADGNFGLIQP